MTEYMDIYKYPNIKKCHMIRQINVEKGTTRATGTRTDRQTDRRQRQQKIRRNQLKIKTART